MASKRCPACKLVNPASSERCDCGRSFVDGSMGTSLDDRIASRQANRVGERPAGLTALGLLNLIFGGLAGIYFLILISQVSSAAPSIPGFVLTILGVMAVTLILLIAAGIGYLAQKGWGRVCGNAYAVMSLLSTLVWVLMVPVLIGWTTILGTVYPVTTLVLINTRFKDAFVD